MDHPNTLTGLWPFAFPYGEARRPYWGQWLYILTDADGRVCYVGQTSNLITRLRKHATNKAFARWEAFKCDGAAEARYYEAQLIEIHQPYLRHDGTAW